MSLFVADRTSLHPKLISQKEIPVMTHYNSLFDALCNIFIKFTFRQVVQYLLEHTIAGICIDK